MHLIVCMRVCVCVDSLVKSVDVRGKGGHLCARCSCMGFRKVFVFWAHWFGGSSILWSNWGN